MYSISVGTDTYRPDRLPPNSWPARKAARSAPSSWSWPSHSTRWMTWPSLPSGASAASSHAAVPRIGVTPFARSQPMVSAAAALSAKNEHSRDRSVSYTHLRAHET